MKENEERREAIESADDTGLVAGEELITQAETLLPIVRSSLPHDRLHAALPHGHAGHAAIDELHAEIHKSRPNAQSIERHVGVLRALPELEAIVVNWWENPKTQRFFGILGQIGA
jgi:hypothetical protein